MKNINIKIKFPKVRLTVFLRVVLAAAVLLEAGVLVRFLLVEAKPAAPETSNEQVVKINRAAVSEAQKWFTERENFVAPDYVLNGAKGKGLGRENPFFEYK